jgi:C_GCAxxG_C_C family probable redox protein
MRRKPMNDPTLDVIRFAGRGYCCSQILLLLALEAQEATNRQLVRAVGGLCMGIAGSGGACGILSGAACVLSLYAGKGSDEEKTDERLSLMYAELTDWFEETVGKRHGGVTCTQILGEGGRRPDPGLCGQILVDTHKKVIDILIENGFDPVVPREYEEF